MCWKGVMDGLEEGKGWVGRANGAGMKGGMGGKDMRDRTDFNITE